MAETPRLVHHLITFVVRIVEFNTSARNEASKADGVVSDEEIRRFLRMRSQGGSLAMKAQLEGNVDFGATMAAAHEKRVAWAAALKIQLARRAKTARRRLCERRAAIEQAASHACVNDEDGGAEAATANGRS